MKSIIQRCTQITVAPEDEPIFSELATSITIEDEGVGEFLKVSQINDHAKKGTIEITPEEWPTIRDAIDVMIAACRKEDA